MMTLMYADDNNSSTHGVHVGDTAWQHAYRGWYENQPKIRCCPEAVKPESEGGKHPYAAWGKFGPNDYYNFKEGDYGSYGENGFMQNPLDASGEYAGPGRYWKTPYVKEASNAPGFLGCVWMGGFVNTFTTGHPEGRVFVQEYEVEYWSSMLGRYMVNRHNGYVGSSFLDGSARKVGLKELFRVKWNRLYDKNRWYEWQEDIGWPEWIKNFKDY